MKWENTGRIKEMEFHFGKKLEAPEPQTPNIEERLFRAFRENDPEKIQNLKKEYEEKYKNQTEGVDALFDLVPFFEAQKELREKKEERGDRVEKIKSCTEYQFLLTHLISQNTENRSFLGKFWSTAGSLATITGNQKAFESLQNGILSQVATLKIFEALGKNPQLPHPDEDAFHSIDLWVSDEEVVQIKGTPYQTAGILETDTIGFPVIETQENGQREIYSSFYYDNLHAFKAKISRYEEIIHHSLKAYFVVIPYDQFDSVTGEPSKKMIELVKENLEKKGKNLE